jgi:hypothetical protein
MEEVRNVFSLFVGKLRLLKRPSRTFNRFFFFFTKLAVSQTIEYQMVGSEINWKAFGCGHLGVTE